SPSAISVISVNTSVSSCSKIPDGLKVNINASRDLSIQYSEAFSSTKNQLITSILLLAKVFHIRIEVFYINLLIILLCETKIDMLGNKFLMKFFKLAKTSY